MPTNDREESTALSIMQELRWRELIAQQSDPTGTEQLLVGGPQVVYAGFDPTASSLHVGNLVPLIALRRFQLAGHRPIAVVGGGTGLIGDPSGKSAERALNEKDVVDAWAERIRRQISCVIDLGTGSCGGLLLNNYDWIGGMSAVSYLRDLGKHFSVNAMCAKDSIHSRLTREGVGISYTEFSYMILQAFDFAHLYANHGCRLQIGGSDQWGNMTAGIDLIGRNYRAQAYAITFPLITTSSGKKFGKTEEGTVWLDPERTSPYAFYQYWINTDDRDAVRFLKYFTFLDREEVDSLAKATRANPEAREAQKRVAAELTRLVHGESELRRVLRATEALFGSGDVSELDAETLLMALASVPQVKVRAGTEVPGLAALLVEAGLLPSRTQARKAVEAGGIYLNGRRVTDPDYCPDGPSDFLHGYLLVLRRGKKNYAIVQKCGI